MKNIHQNKQSSRQGKNVLHLTFTEGPSQCNKTSKGNKRHVNGKEKSKALLICR